MADLYLIAHKCSGKAAFDIAIQTDCPECTKVGCPECDNLGYWWIIPTSGHRAYPWWFGELNHIFENQLAMNLDEITNGMPTDLPDHYTVNASPKAPKRNLLAELGLATPKANPTIVGKLTRRI